MKKLYFAPQLCVDCGVEVQRGAKTCRPCKHARLRHPEKHCVDCGVPVERRATRCPACSAKQRRSPVRMCERCHIVPLGRRTTWCWDCSYIMRDKRQGLPHAVCTRCGAQMTHSLAVSGLCGPCRREIKRPQRFCPSCGVPVQRHVAMCRTCTARTRQVRTEDDLTYGHCWAAQQRAALKHYGAACRKCGVTKASGALIHMHHIVPWRVNHDSSLGNLSPLCVQCHGAIHVIYRRRPLPTPEVFASRFKQFLGIS